jgi:hypothetical protein
MDTFIWLATGTGSCEHGKEPSGSIKCVEFLEWFRVCGPSRTTLLQGVA